MCGGVGELLTPIVIDPPTTAPDASSSTAPPEHRRGPPPLLRPSEPAASGRCSDRRAAAQPWASIILYLPAGSGKAAPEGSHSPV